MIEKLPPSALGGDTASTISSFVMSAKTRPSAGPSRCPISAIVVQPEDEQPTSPKQSAGRSSWDSTGSSEQPAAPTATTTAIGSDEILMT